LPREENGFTPPGCEIALLSWENQGAAIVVCGKAKNVGDAYTKRGEGPHGEVGIPHLLRDPMQQQQ
jgi:hypothetical protein